MVRLRNRTNFVSYALVRSLRQFGYSAIRLAEPKNLCEGIAESLRLRVRRSRRRITFFEPGEAGTSRAKRGEGNRLSKRLLRLRRTRKRTELTNFLRTFLRLRVGFAEPNNFLRTFLRERSEAKAIA
uniref:Uncharacterized protein n=1 Tax=Pediastrum duplex TaxID=3105 RepID=A0A2U8GIG7_PEDDU|nr:hypothetical protein [Pediastrum duplex]AWI68447.1 hypothetical protein [Pediastrum duplex]